MKLKLTYVWLTLLVIPTLFTACKKDAADIDTTKNAIGNVRRTATVLTPNLLENAKAYYQNRANARLANATAARRSQSFGIPSWEFAVVLDSATNLIFVPMTNTTFFNTGVRYYLFKTFANGETKGVVIETLYDDAYFERLTNDPETHGPSLKHAAPNFTGFIFQYEIDGTFVRGRLFDAGLVTGEVVTGTQTSTLATDPDDDDDDTEIDPGEPPAEGGEGGGSNSTWVIDLPGVIVTPSNPFPPLPGWTPSDPPTANPYPPAGPVDDRPRTDPGDEQPPTDGEETVEFGTEASFSVPLNDLWEHVVDFSLRSNKKKQDGLITKVFGYSVRAIPLQNNWTDENGYRVSRLNTVFNIRGSHSFLPAPSVKVTWKYDVNYRYTFVPRLPVVTKEVEYETSKIETY